MRTLNGKQLLLQTLVLMLLFWGGKINVTFDWYEKNTSDILMKLAMPGIFLGSLDAPYQNAGKVRNRGWELAANYFDQKGDWHGRQFLAFRCEK
mgnify:CR=1 FL=1